MDTETKDKLLDYVLTDNEAPFSSAPETEDIVASAIAAEAETNRRKTASELAKEAYRKKKEHDRAQSKRKATVDVLVPTDESAPPSVQQAMEVFKGQVKPKVPKTSPTVTTRASVVKLMSALNINLDLQLTKRDTATLLSCLLTANENQLKALQNNNKIPIAIKTVIKRLLDDAKTGNMETVERMWDRLFGKMPMTESAGLSQSIIPGAPSSPDAPESILPQGVVSRETYMVIKETLMK